MNSAIRAEIAAALGARVTDARSLSGGSISAAWRLALADGRTAFAKTNASAPRDMFPREAEGLAALAGPGILRVPRVLAAEPRFIVLEWIEPGRADAAAMARFGEALAAHHRATARAGDYGFAHDNYIGSTPQANAPLADWVGFWRERRLLPQLALARRHGRGDAALQRLGERLAARLGEWLDPAEPGCLLHGDLWSGNLLAAAKGPAAVIDPAAYRGAREADLAMMLLFGGFGGPCLEAYCAAWPLAPGQRDRIAIYQVYHVLNHLNLFGEPYGGQARAMMEALVG
jgi:fructosamine-3-kinase